MDNQLFMLLLGCKPTGRSTEQHDIFFGIGTSLKELIPAIKKSWPAAKGNIHIDAWRLVTLVDGYRISVLKNELGVAVSQRENGIFFINLGGYKENEFDEFHYKMLVVAANLEAAKSKAKKSAFFKHVTVKKSPNNPNATAHIDDKYGIDIDDAYKLEDILPALFKEKYHIVISPQHDALPGDELHLGYFKLVDL